VTLFLIAVRSHSTARQLVHALLLAASLGLFAPSALWAQQSAILQSGQSVPGRLVPETSGYAFVTDAAGKRPQPLSSLKYILLNSSAAHLLPTSPLRQLYFAGGDHVTCEVLPLGADRWKLRVRGRTDFIVPRAAISAIAQPASQTLRLYDDFTVTAPNSTRPDDALAHSTPHCLRLEAGKSRDWTLPEPLATGTIQVWFLSTLDSSLVNDEWGVEIRTPAPRSAKVRVLLGGSGDVYTIDGGLFSVQRLRRSAGWHCLSLSIAKGRLRFAIDGALLADGQPDVPAAGAITLFHHDTMKAASDVRFDDLLIVEQTSDRALALRLPPLRQDLVVQRSGDELFGRLTEVSPLRVRLQGPLDALVLPWQGVRSVAWGDQAAGITMPVQGQFARIELTSVAGLGDESADILTGAISRLTSTELEFQHPWLGTLRLPLTQVGKIIPDGQGRRWLLDARAHHLGDEVRADFVRQIPEGSNLSVPLTLDKVPVGETFVLVNAVDLEPAGPQAVPSPILDQLHQGQLTTELRINDDKVTDLNHFVSLKESGQPVRLRIPVPAKFWKPGSNMLKFVQRPKGDEPGSFDDCELSEVWLETTRKEM